MDCLRHNLCIDEGFYNVLYVSLLLDVFPQTSDCISLAVSPEQRLELWTLTDGVVLADFVPNTISGVCASERWPEFLDSGVNRDWVW